MSTSVTARKIFRAVWAILDATATDTRGSDIGDPWWQLMVERDEEVGYADTVLRIWRGLLGEGQHSMLA